MASDILSNSYLKLNQNQADILFEIMLTGSKLAKGVLRLHPDVVPGELLLYSKRLPLLVSRLGDSIV